MKLTVLLAPKLPNSCCRTWRQLETTIQRINMCWFSEDVLTLPVHPTMRLERLLRRITSCRSAAATPTGFYVPCRDCTRYMAEPAQRRGPTHTIIIAMSRGEWTSPTFFPSCLFVSERSCHRSRHLNLRVMELFGLSFRVLCHGLDDAM